MGLSTRTVRILLAALVLSLAAMLVVGNAESERTSDQVTSDPSVGQATRSGDRSSVVDPVPGTTATGERTDLHSRVTAGKHSTRWHDVDRIDDDRTDRVGVGRPVRLRRRQRRSVRRGLDPPQRCGVRGDRWS
ncbi:MAG: hypothetical protein V5A38_13290 [Halolamina sp.]|uniref:hypothetical protein n=1 Tax=Halolamina sp. TaxID=1940283 RepID=UPI002FC35391